MSQMAIARTARAGRSAASRTRAPLRVVDAAPATRSHAGFVALCLALVLAGLLSALLLNTARAESSFTLSDLRAEQTELHDTRVTLEAELSQQRSPETLAAAAEDLGLVASPSTAVLRLSDNQVLGVAAQVDPADSRTVVTPFVTAIESAVEGGAESTEQSREGAVQGG